MSRTTRRFSTASACALGLALLGLFSAATQAATISYGNFGPVPPGVTFLNVEESSGTDSVPIYGPPTAFSVGLDFNPTNFVASSISGGADLTDGQLNFTMSSALPIASLSLSERGDFTLAGVGTAATQVQAGAIILATVTEINGVGVAPINLLPVNGSVGFNLTTSAGIVQPWSVNLGLDVASQVPGATKIAIAINNSLVATSEASAVAFIAKKDFIVRGEVVPEPSTVAMIGLALCGLAGAGRRRS